MISAWWLLVVVPFALLGGAGVTIVGICALYDWLSARKDRY